MMTPVKTLLLGLPLVLAACLPATDPTPPPMENACGASGLQGLIGQRASVLAAMSLPEPLRVIHPGQPVTMDMRPDRLNIELNDQQIITRVSCG